MNKTHPLLTLKIDLDRIKQKVIEGQLSLGQALAQAALAGVKASSQA